MKYTKEILDPIVRDAKSIAQVIRALGLREAGGNYSHMKRTIVKFGIDMSHFTGMGHTKGQQAFNRLDWQDILVKRVSGTRQKSHLLRRSLAECGVEYVCVGCGTQDKWNGKPITLEVDHINEDWLDDRKENLQFLCPNCHSQK